MEYKLHKTHVFNHFFWGGLFLGLKLFVFSGCLLLLAYIASWHPYIDGTVLPFIGKHFYSVLGGCLLAAVLFEQIRAKRKLALLISLALSIITALLFLPLVNQASMAEALFKLILPVAGGAVAYAALISHMCFVMNDELSDMEDTEGWGAKMARVRHKAPYSLKGFGLGSVAAFIVLILFALFIIYDYFLGAAILNKWAYLLNQVLNSIVDMGVPTRQGEVAFMAYGPSRERIYFFLLWLAVLGVLALLVVPLQACMRRRVALGRRAAPMYVFLLVAGIVPYMIYNFDRLYFVYFY